MYGSRASELGVDELGSIRRITLVRYRRTLPNRNLRGFPCGPYADTLHLGDTLPLPQTHENPYCVRVSSVGAGGLEPPTSAV